MRGSCTVDEVNRQKVNRLTILSLSFKFLLINCIIVQTFSNIPWIHAFSAVFNSNRNIYTWSERSIDLE